jgi:thiol-disulfide isomerase/thioredoxin
MYTIQAIRALLIGILLLIAPFNSFAANKLPKGIIQLDGKSAPALVLKDLEGTSTYDINNAKGHWVFVHFWATWCGPCRREMPLIQTIHPKFEKSRLEIILVNTAESEDVVFTFMGDVAPDLNPLLDLDGAVTESWQPRGLPATYLVDPNGKLQYVALGGRPWDKPEYLDFLQQLIKE